VRNIGDLSKTMGGLMRNVIHEVQRSRDDMLRDMDVLEGGDGSTRMSMKHFFFHSCRHARSIC
jgi:hypothetical protein